MSRAGSKNLGGSTLNNPWVLTDRGDLVLASDIPQPKPLRPARVNVTTPPRHALIIFRGLPSTIPRSFGARENREPSTANAGSSGASRTDTSIRTARDDANHRPGNNTLARRRASTGQQPGCTNVWTKEDLYVDSARPPPLDAPKEHHVCSICHDVKSHPVSYQCGHSHCYVCIRLWLEKKKMTCPECSKVMHSAPFRHYGEEHGIEHEYPAWNDQSRVWYDWQGLIFPGAEN
ncbi:hypothetical protein B0H11DRAFT_2244237 [Mycena galericulata]|nr:hypothetical protein B0H11DRAFT_2244237 [Mycena galericulata]